MMAWREVEEMVGGAVVITKAVVDERAAMEAMRSVNLEEVIMVVVLFVVDGNAMLSTGRYLNFFYGNNCLCVEE
jgi:hypothetical protein